MQFNKSKSPIPNQKKTRSKYPAIVFNLFHQIKYVKNCVETKKFNDDQPTFGSHPAVSVFRWKVQSKHHNQHLQREQKSKSRSAVCNIY